MNDVVVSFVISFNGVDKDKCFIMLDLVVIFEIVIGDNVMFFVGVF